MEPYIGEIKLFAGTYAPIGWLFCDGSVRSIAEYDALFALIGTTYGGDGVTNFALPDMRSRVPVHMGTGPSGQIYTLGQSAGAENQTLTTANLPPHSHVMSVSTAAGTSQQPANTLVLATTGDKTIYSDGAGDPTAMAPQAIGPSFGGGQSFSKVMPGLVISFIIAYEGIYPSPQ